MIDHCEREPSQESLNKQNAEIAKQFYSLRAKFYDKFNIRHDCDNIFEDLVMNKFEQLTKKAKKEEKR